MRKFNFQARLTKVKTCNLRRYRLKYSPVGTISLMMRNICRMMKNCVIWQIFCSATIPGNSKFLKYFPRVHLYWSNGVNYALVML